MYSLKNFKKRMLRRQNGKSWKLPQNKLDFDNNKKATSQSQMKKDKGVKSDLKVGMKSLKNS